MKNLISLVHPSYLSDSHLLCEFQSLKRLLTLAVKHHNRFKKLPNNIPQEYCTGQGHLLFFYNKLGWVIDRIECVSSELGARGYAIVYKDIKNYANLFARKWLSREWLSAYTPTHEDIYLSMARLCTDINHTKVNNFIKDKVKCSPWLKDFEPIPVLHDQVG